MSEMMVIFLFPIHTVVVMGWPKGGSFMKLLVRSHDTLSYYSQLFMIPLDLIVDSNEKVDPSNLTVGEEIVIPGFIAEPYQIKRGDTFFKLAKQLHLRVDAFKLLNPSKDPNRLLAGETIHIPKRVIYPVVNGKIKYDYSAICRNLSQLQAIYPFIKIRSIGTSVLGQPIQEITIGKGRKKVHINASFHANEWITSAVLMTFLNDYLLAMTNCQSICGIPVYSFYENVELSLVPMVNPDGVNLVLHGPPVSIKDKVVRINGGSEDFTAWKANIRGVDLNNQFPANWEIEKERKEPKAEAPRDFPGAEPLTEPEAIAMARLAKQRKFDLLIALHTQGEEFYWGYEGMEPPESAAIAKEFERVSGYKAVQYVDSHAGYKDWFIQEFKKPGFTIELGKGINPLPLSQFYAIYQKVYPLLLAALYM
jgi:g-D-glutamyl-meso-diaminopimelate peptidase